MVSDNGSTLAVVQCLKTREPMELKNPARVRDPTMSDKIADLKLHPAIESGLHILNDDIVSAHFVRGPLRILNWACH